MTEYCFQSTDVIIKNNKNKNNTINLSDFSILCSFILSHPLYFSYLIFFSPYLIKLLSFLSPLFLTTSLLLLSLFTTIIPFHSIISSKDCFFLTAYNTLLEELRPNSEEGENLVPLEEFELYKVVFDVPTFELSEENPVESVKFEENPVEFCMEKVVQVEETVKQCESLTVENVKVDTCPKKVEEKVVKKQETSSKSSGSEVIKDKKLPKLGSLRLNSSKKLSDSDLNLGSFGSTRVEKEWRRTLACKLFEERHNWSNNNINVNGGEGEDCMDLLWETPEAEPSKGNTKIEEHKKGRRKEKIETLVKHDDEEDEYEEDYYDNGKICCLQALKLSAGKMNLSMGRPNLVKFTKAFKGIGWLQSHVRRQGKKGYK